jgi:hypothetical protein
LDAFTFAGLELHKKQRRGRYVDAAGPRGDSAAVLAVLPHDRCRRFGGLGEHLHGRRRVQQRGGHDALVESIRRGGTDRPLRHLHSNLKLVPTAEGADGHVYVVQIDITAKPISVATYSRYDDKLVKTAEGWRFKSRQRSPDTTIAPGGGRSAQQTAPPR